MSRAIRADKDAYLKLGSLQTATSKGQVSLKGWQPEQANSISVKKGPSRSDLNNSRLSQSKDVQNFESPDILKSQNAVSISGSLAGLKQLSVGLSGGDRVNLKKTSEVGAPNLSPMRDVFKNRNKANSSM